MRYGERLPPHAKLSGGPTRVRARRHHFYMINDSETGGSLSEDEWEIIKGRHLLTDGEIAQINAYNGYKPLLPLAWAMTEVESAVIGVKFEDRAILKLNRPGGTKITDI